MRHQLNTKLTLARKYKQDEFYTSRSDIEKELVYYKQHFKDKVVYCNCDNPFESEFFRYFVDNFNHLGLKKLVATSYSGYTPQRMLFNNVDDNRKPYKAVITTIGDYGGNMLDIEFLFRQDKNSLELLKGDNEYGAGDFRSQECIELLKEADIVCTNPPFSLWREYVSLLMEHSR